MARTRANGQDGRPPLPPTEATRGRGRGRGRARGRAAGAASVDPPVAPAQDHVLAAETPAAPAQAPAVPIVIPGLQEALAQILTVCTGLAQAVLTTTAAATSQAGGGNQTPAARTPEPVVQGLQTPEAPPVQQVAPVQPVALVQDNMVPVMPDDEQHRLETFSRFAPPTFSGAQGEDAQGFLDKCRRMLRTVGILEASGVSFTIFQFSGAAFTWWEAYERRRPVGSAPLSWQEFSTLFLEKWVPRSQREEMRRQFEYLHQGDMTVSQYEVRFSELAHYAPWMVPTDRERIRRFVDGLNYPIRILMARERILSHTFEDAVDVARDIEMDRRLERGVGG
ncbi:uncharacterized protein [Nicotiana sylvestris]|uniref:uncharacterized protein n=1 Tax=Nicotiana sylvestris TaxID=4096 RepID=UPI00388C7894